MTKYTIKNLEFNITHACNYRCASCDHLSPFFSQSDSSHADISIKNFSEWVTILSKHIVVENFLILGGEPLLHKELSNYLEVLKNSKLAQKCVLVTNGSLLGNMDERLFEQFDRIDVTDYKTQPFSDKNRARLVELCEKYHTDYSVNPVVQFHKSIVGFKHPKWISNMFFQVCPLTWNSRCYTLYNGMLARCSRIPFISYKLKQVGKISEEFVSEDSLKIVDREGFADEVKKYFESSDKAPIACDYCLGGYGTAFPHRFLSKDEIQQETWQNDKAFSSVQWIKLFRRYLRKLILKRF